MFYNGTVIGLALAVVKCCQESHQVLELKFLHQYFKTKKKMRKRKQRKKAEGDRGTQGESISILTWTGVFEHFGFRSGGFGNVSKEILVVVKGWFVVHQGRRPKFFVLLFLLKHILIFLFDGRACLDRWGRHNAKILRVKGMQKSNEVI